MLGECLVLVDLDEASPLTSTNLALPADFHSIIRGKSIAEAWGDFLRSKLAH